MKYSTYGAPNNDQAKSLREAAIEFTKGIDAPVRDDADLDGQVRNRKLLSAAIAFTNSLTAEQRAELLQAPRLRRVRVG